MDDGFDIAVDIVFIGSSVRFSFSNGLDVVEREFSTYELAQSWLDGLFEQLIQTKVDEVFGQ